MGRMALVLHSFPSSSNALKVRFLLAELGLDYELRAVPQTRPRPAEYLALNPRGGVPTLVDGDFVLTESNTILRYLATREGRQDLYPTENLRERSRVDECLDRFFTGIRQEFMKVEAPALGHTLAGGMGSRPADPEAAAEAMAGLVPILQLLDELVEPEGAVLGRFTIADIGLAPILNRTTHTGLDLTPYPNLDGLKHTIVSRPAFAQAGPVL
jgi:glutathione S-transferase